MKSSLVLDKPLSNYLDQLHACFFWRFFNYLAGNLVGTLAYQASEKRLVLLRAD